jgi:hypothetical protein
MVSRGLWLNCGQETPDVAGGDSLGCSLAQERMHLRALLDKDTDVPFWFCQGQRAFQGSVRLVGLALGFISLACMTSSSIAFPFQPRSSLTWTWRRR